MHYPTLSEGSLASHSAPALLYAQNSKVMLLHIQEYEEIIPKEAKPLAMTLQRATVGLALERKPIAMCVDAYLN